MGGLLRLLAELAYDLTVEWWRTRKRRKGK